MRFAAEPRHRNRRCSVQHRGDRHARIAGAFVAGGILIVSVTPHSAPPAPPRNLCHLLVENLPAGAKNAAPDLRGKIRGGFVEVDGGRWQWDPDGLGCTWRAARVRIIGGSRGGSQCGRGWYGSGQRHRWCGRGSPAGRGWHRGRGCGSRCRSAGNGRDTRTSRGSTDGTAECVRYLGSCR